MNWKYVKLILLCLLLCANLLLLHFSYTDSLSRVTGEPTAAIAADLLAARGITVDPGLLTGRDPAIRLLSGDYVRENYLASVCHALLGREADRFYLLPDGVRADCDDGGSITVGNDFSIRYLAGGEDEGTLRRALALAAPLDSEDKNAFRAALGLSKDALQETLCTKNGNYTFLTVKEAESGLPLEGMTCLFAFVDGKCVFASGNYCFCTFAEAEDTPILTRYNILLKEASRAVSGEVVAMTAVYALYESAAEERLLAVPAYRITYADGQISTVSALDGKPW